MRSFIAFILCFQSIVISSYPDHRVIRETNDNLSFKGKSSDPKEIFRAVENGDVQQVRDLLAKGVNIRNYGDGYIPLHRAAANGYKDIVQLLIDNGADFRSIDKNGHTPLHKAAAHGHKDIAQLFIDRGADFQSKNHNGKTPLHLAVHNGHKEVARLLIDKTADINIRSNDGRTPLHEAAIWNQFEIARLLIERGADENAKDSKGKTAAQLALEKGHMDIVQLLNKNIPLDQVTQVAVLSKPSLRPAQQACQTFEKLTENKILRRGSALAKTAEFPWMAALGYIHHINNTYIVTFDCGGTIISDTFILTAAHCVTQSQSPGVVRLGKVNLIDTDEESPENHNVKDIKRHPEYSAKTKKNDIALILVSRIFFTDIVAPACLQIDVRDESADVKMIVSGWGATVTDGQSQSNALRKAQFVSMPWAECNAKLLKFNEYANDEALRDGLNQGQYCTYDPHNITDSCAGDSGGPVQHFKNHRLSTVIGVVSFGFGCGTGMPSISTRVAYYLDWIESVIWPNGFMLQ
ncbi:serine protease persephone-like [Sitodiplosis mosellana]|uniref:serine protease persephone-like n=1 Tax=Sitodiplosis mosellana TaxID=263140 RepID=UPI00244533A1|nr:serine protease persephone-like [Sitodiplosis mosellana]